MKKTIFMMFTLVAIIAAIVAVRAATANETAAIVTVNAATTNEDEVSKSQFSTHFSDVPSTAEYAAILMELNAIEPLGYGDGTFRPDEPITRSEFVTLMLRILAKPDLNTVARDQIFTDVPVSHWANKYVTFASKSGIVAGDDKGAFRPSGTVKFEEMSKVAVVYLLGKGSERLNYPDKYLELASGLKLDKGIGLKRGEDAKRWQAVLMIYNTLNADTASVEVIKDSLRYITPGNANLYEDDMALSDGMTARADTALSHDITVRAAVGGSLFAAEAPSIRMFSDYGTAEHEKSAVKPAMPTMVPRDDSETIAFEPPYYDDFYYPPYENGSAITSGLLTAGEWNDNANWGFWQRLMANREYYNLQGHWEISTDRYVVNVTDDGTPVIGAHVTLSGISGELWSAVTDNKGNAVLFATIDPEYDRQSNDLQLSVATSADRIVIEGVILSDDRPYNVELRAGHTDNLVDVMFMIDTTGSMGDELQYIKEELKDVVERVLADVRVSMNFYRDIGDEYIVRPFDFTRDVDEAVGQIAAQRAAGGGDYPEAVEIALLNAIDEHDWNPYAREHLLFLVLDAPPHHDAERIRQINDCIRKAAAKGIRIIPVASSGIDKETEFLLRSLAITTNGTYVFLTDDSGIGDPHLEPTVGEYKVEFLNDLLVRIINERL